MKNHWIRQSVNRRFSRIKHYIEGQWVGLASTKGQNARGYMMTISVKVEANPSFSITGNIPPSFKKTIEEKTALQHVAYIYLNGPDDWEIKIPEFGSFTKSLHWNSFSLPMRTDPAFLLRLEHYIDKAVAAWKNFQTAKQEAMKCEESSSS